jgi:hypothetical protein
MNYGWGHLLGIEEKKKHKYLAKPKEIDGIYFPSTREAEIYQEHLLEQKAGLIEGLKVHPKYRIFVCGQFVCSTSLDFVFFDKQTNAWVYEDVKGQYLPMSKLKHKLLEITQGIKVRIVK